MAADELQSTGINSTTLQVTQLLISAPKKSSMRLRKSERLIAAESVPFAERCRKKVDISFRRSQSNLQSAERQVNTSARQNG